MSYPSGFSSFSSPSSSPFSSFSRPSSSNEPLSTLNPLHHPHQVAFGSIPGSQPGVLSWGIGMSSANRNGLGWGTPSQSVTSPPSIGWGSATPTTSSNRSPTPTNSRRRRRSETPPEEERSNMEQRPVRSVPRPGMGSSKRSRIAATDGLANGLAGSLSLGGTSNATASGGGADLGKSLASLDKPALLNILTSLLTTHPHLSSQVTSLLPPPTLESTLSQITHLSRQVSQSLPTGFGLRSEYIYGRIRVPLEDYVQESRKLLNLYVPPTLPSSSSSSTASTEELYHPTTTMTFLLHLTHSLLDLESILPPSSQSQQSNSSNPSNATAAATSLQTHLLPSLINSFHLFITRLSRSVNDQGKILALSTVRGWFESIEQLVDRSTGGGNGNGNGNMMMMSRKALEGVYERFKKEIGWLVGLKPTIENHSTGGDVGMGGMDEGEEEL